MRKRLCLILERCDADLEKLIREDSENGPSPLQSRRAAPQQRYQASPKGKAAQKAAQRRYEASPKRKAALKAAKRRYDASPKWKAAKRRHDALQSSVADEAHSGSNIHICLGTCRSDTPILHLNFRTAHDLDSNV